jgi:hypothetical protein
MFLVTSETAMEAGAAEMEGAVEGAVEVEGEVEGAVEGTVEGANDGLLVDFAFFFFSVAFFLALAIVGLAEVGLFVGLLVLLSPFFFFCRRLSVILPPDADAPALCCASEVQAKTDSHSMASSAVDAS